MMLAYDVAISVLKAVLSIRIQHISVNEVLCLRMKFIKMGISVKYETLYCLLTKDWQASTQST